MCQRSLLQVPMKLASLGIEACFVFETYFLRSGKLWFNVWFNDFS